MDRFKVLISAFLPKSATTDISTTDIPAVADTAAIGTAGAGTKSAAGGARIRAEQLRVFAELQSRAFYFAPPTLAFFAASFAIEWVNPWHAALWWAAMMIVMMTNHLTVKKFLGELARRTDFPDEWERQWHFVLAASSLAVSVTWASFAFVFWLDGNFLNNALIIAALTSSTAPLAIFSCSYHPAFYTTVAPICGATILRLLWTDQPVNWMGAVVFVLFTALLSRMCAFVNDFLQRSFYLADERKGLIDALSREKKALDLARRKAEDASRAKTLFLANMSHELRTPLNAIIGFSEVMHSELFGKHAHDNYKQYSHDINSSGQHLLGLINDILDLSRIEAGRMDFSEELLEIEILARDCRKLVELRAAVHDVHIVEDFDTPLPLLKADGRAIRQTWLNLLTNAVKFSPPGRSVYMVARRLGDGSLMIGVHDEGPGIAEDEIEHVIQSFAQGAAGKKNPGSGTGLGLAIVKGLVEEHGGEFRLTSRLGEGTRAEAIFPADRIIDKYSRPHDASQDGFEGGQSRLAV